MCPRDRSGRDEGTQFPAMTKETIIGIDEVGRGCIAGDLLVCAYAFAPAAPHAERRDVTEVARDSKAFSGRARREAVVGMIEGAGMFVFARRTPAQIDASNIRLATLDAMEEAGRALQAALDLPVRFLVDGRDMPPGLAGDGEAVIKGDGKITEISCASVLAKVARDAEMTRLAEAFPGYGFEAHAGYGTRAHREAIAHLGLCEIHRSWAAKFLVT